MKRNPAIFFLCLLLLFLQPVKAQNFHLLKDINKSTGSSPLNTETNTFPYYYPYSGYNIDAEINGALSQANGWGVLPSYAVIGDTALFSISTGSSLRNVLWRSNGEAGGTTPFVSLPDICSQVMSVGKLAFYLDETSGSLMMTDGTAAGTLMVDSKINGSPLPFHNSIYYTKDNSTSNSFSLWKYDTETKTKTLMHQFSTCNCLYEHPMYKGGNFIYIYTRETDSTYSFWKSDGDTLYKLIDNKTGDLPSPVFTENKLFSKAINFIDGAYYSDLSYYDSASGNFNFIARLNKRSGYSEIFKQAYKEDVLYFINGDDSLKYSLWKTDGTAAGTELIKDLYDGDGTVFPVSYMLTSGNNIFYAALNESGSYDLWKTDGTGSGTVMLHHFGTDTKATVFYPADINGTLYFSAYTNEYGFEPWKSDGTAEGTVMVKDIFAGIFSSTPNSFTYFKDSVLFSANDGGYGQELFITDGTAAGTRLFQDINTTVTESGTEPKEPYIFKNKLYFFANDGMHGNELWQSDGTEAGTVLVKDVQPGTLSLNPQHSGYAIASGDNFYFGAENNYPLTSNYTWKTNGVAGIADTVDFKTYSGEIKKINYPVVFPDGPYATGIVDVNNRLAFNYGDSLYITNINQDSAAGVPLSTGLSTPSFSRNDTLIFYNGIYDEEKNNDSIYAYNALSKTSSQIGELRGNSTDGLFMINPLKDIKTTYFTSYDYGDFGTSYLMYSNGTEDGTGSLKVGGLPGCIKDGIMYFSGSPNVNLSFDAEYELWKTDGTTAGTSIIKEINTGIVEYDDGSHKASSNPRSFIVYKDSVYFIAEDSTFQSGLWVTDGTAAHTHLITYIEGNKNLYTGTRAAIANGLMLFASDGKLLQSDGSPEGTLLVPDEAFKHIKLTEGFTIFNDRIFAPAYDSLTGIEMWTGQIKQVPKPYLLSFTGQQRGNDAQLEWHVKNDSIIEHYELERSLDSIEFTSVYNILSKRNAGTTVYPATDANITTLGKDTIYYRLKEILDGGTIRYRNVIALPLNMIIDSGGIVADNSVQVSPNPFGSALRIVAKMTESTNALIMVTDAAGRKLISEKRSLTEGTTTLVYNTASWQHGIYFLSVILDNGIKLHSKIVK